MNDSEFESLMRGMKPATPSLSLEGRIAAQLGGSATVKRHAWLGALIERTLWLGAGAAAMWIFVGTGFPGVGKKPRPAEPSALATSAPAETGVTEVRLPWADEGVQLIGGTTPARLIRRTVIERHPAGAGGLEVRVPREDVIVLPVSFR